MAILCLVIKLTHSPINRQKQLQLIAQGSSPGVEPILDHPREHLGCTLRGPASPTQEVQAQVHGLGLWSRVWIIHPLPSSKYHSSKYHQKVFGILSGSTEFSFHSQKPNIK